MTLSKPDHLRELAERLEAQERELEQLRAEVARWREQVREVHRAEETIHLLARLDRCAGPERRERGPPGIGPDDLRPALNHPGPSCQASRLVIQRVNTAGHLLPDHVMERPH